MYIEALAFAKVYHKGQFRNDRVTPYINHPIKVAGFFEDDYLKSLAVLHDVLEDTDAKEDDIKNKFGSDLLKDLKLLTHSWDDKYMEYINKIKESGSDAVIKVKIADIVSNLSDDPTEKQIKKYFDTLMFIIKGSGVICKGCISIGTGCGSCSSCLKEIKNLVDNVPAEEHGERCICPVCAAKRLK